jgi:hypothetical protein
MEQGGRCKKPLGEPTHPENERPGRDFESSGRVCKDVLCRMFLEQKGGVVASGRALRQLESSPSRIAKPNASKNQERTSLSGCAARQEGVESTSLRTPRPRSSRFHTSCRICTDNRVPFWCLLHPEIPRTGVAYVPPSGCRGRFWMSTGAMNCRA